MQISLTDAVQEFKPEGMELINAPFVRFSSIDLTGDGGTVFLTISLDPQEAWPFGILQNSRYLRLRLDEGKVSCIAKSHELPTFRKVKAATADEAVAVINRYLARVDAAS